jgi:hypothetical protein
MYSNNIITPHIILLIDVYFHVLFLLYIFQILKYYLSVLLGLMCEIQMKEDGGRLRTLGGRVHCYCLCIDTVMISNFMVAWPSVATQG